MAMKFRVEDRLHGAQKFPTWKERISSILDVSDGAEHIDFTKVSPIDATELVAWKNIDSISMMINLDGVKDHIVPHTFGNKTASEMWKDL